MPAESIGPNETGIDWGSQEIAEHWSRGQARRDEVIRPATEMMLDLANLQSGNRVLDVAAGTGEQTLLAARRVGPTGYVLATDLSPSMLNVAAEAARKVGLTNIETRIMDAENLDVRSESFDAVICRLGLMLFSNPPKALRGIYKALKPGGKVAALVFSTAEKNPFQAIPLGVVRRMGAAVLPMFTLGEPGVLENAFTEAGFTDVSVQAMTVQRRFPSISDLMRILRDVLFLREPMAKLRDTDREQAWTEIEQQLRRFQTPNGLELSGEFLIGVGTK
jgi:ubiquinone/menaquinone biosynthesis C-methylase UbiE